MQNSRTVLKLAQVSRPVPLRYLFLKQHEAGFYKQSSRNGLNIAATIKQVTGKHRSGDLR
jgi:hypothetical protein